MFVNIKQIFLKYTKTLKKTFLGIATPAGASLSDQIGIVVTCIMTDRVEFIQILNSKLTKFG